MITNINQQPQKNVSTANSQIFCETSQKHSANSSKGSCVKKVSI